METKLTGQRRPQGVVGSWTPPAAAPSTNEREAGGGGGRALIRAQGTEGKHTPHPHRRDLGAAADSEAGRRVGTLCLLLDSVVNLKLL